MTTGLRLGKDCIYGFQRTVLTRSWKQEMNKGSPVAIAGSHHLANSPPQHGKICSQIYSSSSELHRCRRSVVLWLLDGICLLNVTIGHFQAVNVTTYLSIFSEGQSHTIMWKIKQKKYFKSGQNKAEKKTFLM